MLEIINQLTHSSLSTKLYKNPVYCLSPMQGVLSTHLRLRGLPGAPGDGHSGHSARAGRGEHSRGAGLHHTEDGQTQLDLAR